MSHVPGFPLDEEIFRHMQNMTGRDGLVDILNRLAHSMEIGGELVLDSSAQTVTDQTPAFTPIAGTFSGSHLVEFTYSSGTLTYTGPIRRVFDFLAVLSVSAGTTDNIELRLAVNGTLAVDTRSRRGLVASAAVGNMSVQGKLELDPGDTVWIEVARDGAAGLTLTVETLNMIWRA
jgi:hypothetical protein